MSKVYKRTFSDYFMRSNELIFRKLKVTSKWIVLCQLRPLKSLLLYRRFKRIIRALEKQIEHNRKEGYWI